MLSSIEPTGSVLATKDRDTAVGRAATAPAHAYNGKGAVDSAGGDTRQVTFAERLNSGS